MKYQQLKVNVLIMIVVKCVLVVKCIIYIELFIYNIRSEVMKILDIILPIVLFFLGWVGIQKIPQLMTEDPLLEMNQRTAPFLEKLVQTKFFRIVRMNINEDCQLGVMRRICQSRSCTVCRCDSSDIPQHWSNTQKVKNVVKNKDLWEDERATPEAGWVWHVQDLANDRGEYFDVHTNIESFTNYNGQFLWKLIYEENCFKKEYPQDMCSEEKILYNLISGLHTSISTHLSKFYREIQGQHAWADLRTDTQFHFNATEYQRRVLDHPERIKNLMFLYRLLGKAIVQAAPYLHSNLSITSNDISQDGQARQLLDKLLLNLEGHDLSPAEKESLSFFTPDNPLVKQYQKYIHNISAILDCVECEKCRLFGKMQTYGVGTALKILLGYPTPYKRNEIVALFNVFNKISVSVDTYYKNRKDVIKLGYEKANKKVVDYYVLIAGLMACAYVWSKYKQEYLVEEKPKEQ